MGPLQINSMARFSPWEDQLCGNLKISQKMILYYLNMKPSHVSFEILQQLHGYTLKTGLFRDHYIAGCLIKCYANSEFRSKSTLLAVLDHVTEPNVFVWNSIMKGFMDLELFHEVILMYYQMMVSGSKPNKFTYPPLFGACAMEKCVVQGEQIHCHVVKLGLKDDHHIVSAGIHMYASVGWFDEARNLFVSVGKSDVICCNAMINGYMKYGEVEAGLELFEGMKKKSVSSWNTVITGLFSCGRVDEARSLFDKMDSRDEVSWSAMIDGYNKLGFFTEALEVFNELQNRGRGKNFGKFVLSSAVSSCANAGALDQGKWIHGYIKRSSIVVDAVLGTCLIDMYAKCGELDLAWDVFGMVEKPQVSCWNAMIGALAIHGLGNEAIGLFSKMLEHSLRPNGITLVSLLNACAHSGLVEEGLCYFITMRNDHGIEPTVEHYGCVVNLLAKAGHIEEAEQLIESMPMKPNAAVLGALLGATRLPHKKKPTLAAKIGKTLLDSEPGNSGRYALLSNIYAEAGDFDEVGKIRKQMKDSSIITVTGSSMITVDGTVHEFKNGDSNHSKITEIHKILENLIHEIKIDIYHDGYGSITLF